MYHDNADFLKPDAGVIWFQQYGAMAPRAQETIGLLQNNLWLGLIFSIWSELVGAYMLLYYNFG